LIAVKENQTVLNITNEKMEMRNVIEVNSYLEAAGVVVALREGISIESLRRPIYASTRIDLPTVPSQIDMESKSPNPVEQINLAV
jgi:hypothetical protein